jgi:hypothetical protein
MQILDLFASLSVKLDQASVARGDKAMSGIQMAVTRVGQAADATRAKLTAMSKATTVIAAPAKVSSSGLDAAPAKSGFNPLALLGGAFAAYQVKNFSEKVVKLASDVNETENVLEQTFGPAGAKRVENWALVTGQAMGRSEFQLREFAGQLGAVLEPTVGMANAEKMSEVLTGLAVDLGSFFNTSDEQAKLALQSGIIGGEAEPLRKYGVMLSDATLQEFAHTKGINKKITAMTIAEKTQLRYDFVLSRTTKAQGDAARTLDGYANASKALDAAMRSLQTRLGQALLPVFRAFNFVAQGTINWFLKLQQGSNFLGASLVTLATFFTLLGVQAAWAGREAMWSWIKAAAPFIAIAAILVVIALAIDDVTTFLTGGKSAIGEWMDAWGGTGTASRVLGTWADGLNILVDAVKAFAASPWKTVVDAAKGFGSLFSTEGKGESYIGPDGQQHWRATSKAAGGSVGSVESYARATGRGTQADAFYDDGTPRTAERGIAAAVVSGGFAQGSAASAGKANAAIGRLSPFNSSAPVVANVTVNAQTGADPKEIARHAKRATLEALSTSAQNIRAANGRRQQSPDATPVGVDPDMAAP